MNSKELATTQKKPRFSVAITTEGYQTLIKNTLQDPDRCKRFVASITSAVAVNPALQECEAPSILAGALLGESLNLSPSPQLGQYYLIPFKTNVKDKKTNKAIIGEDGKPIQTTKAQFCIGYRGLIQLALRSGYYKHLNVIEVKEGELVKFNPFTEEFVCDWIEDEQERNKRKTIGYAAMFEYLNGFQKVMYWSYDKMLVYADRYSKAFSAEAYEKLQSGKVPEKELWKYSSFWYQDFDGMSKKTMLRQIISKWGVMSVEMQNAFDKDDKAIEMNENGSFFAAGDIDDAADEINEAIQEAAEPERIDLANV